MGVCGMAAFQTLLGLFCLLASALSFPQDDDYNGDYNGDYKSEKEQEDNLLELIRRNKYGGSKASSEESEEEVLDDGIPNIEGLKKEADGTLTFNGEKVTSISAVDGPDGGKKVYESPKVYRGSNRGLTLPPNIDEIEEIKKMIPIKKPVELKTPIPIETIEEVIKKLPIETIQEIKKMTPIKSIQEIANIREVKSIKPVPDAIARDFIKRHKLRSLTMAGGYASSEEEAEVDVGEPPVLNPALSRGCEAQVKAIYGITIDDLEAIRPAKVTYKGDEIDSIEPVKSITSLKSVQALKSVQEVKKLYELTPLQAQILKRMQLKKKRSYY